MVIRFGIEADALLEYSNPADALAADSRLFRDWETYGVLCNPEEVVEKLGNMNTDRRKRWQFAMKINWTCNKYKIKIDDKLIDQLSSSVPYSAASLFCLEESRASTIIEDGESSSITPSGAEVCYYKFSDQAEQFNRLRTLWSAPIEVGTQVQDIWASRFAGIAENSKFISIVDRFGIQNAIRDVKPNIPSNNGLLNLLRLINLSGLINNKSINIYSSNKHYTEKSLFTAQDVVRLFSNIFSIVKLNNISSIHVHLCDDRSFSTIAHDRFLRFDKIVTGIGAGVSLFKPPVCSQNYLCNITSDSSGIFQKVMENELKKNCVLYTRVK